MVKSLATKILSVLALGILLVHLSPVATGMLLCIAGGTDPDCCSKPHASQARVDQRFLKSSDCSCCITIDAAPSTAGANYQKASLDILSGMGLLRNEVPIKGTRISRAAGHDPGESRLSSLRTVILLI